MVLFLTFVVSSPLLHIGRLYLPCRPSSPDSGSCLQPGNWVGSGNNWHLPKITNLRSLSQAPCAGCALSGCWCPRHQHALCFVWGFFGGWGILTRSKNYTKYLNTQKFCLIKCILLLKLLSCCLDTTLSSFSCPSNVRTFPYHMQ